MKNKKTHKGNLTVKVSLILVLLGIVAGTAYFAYKSKQTADATLQAASTVSESTAKFKKPQALATLVAQPKDVTNQWKVFQSPKGVFSVKYPLSWVQPPPNTCSQTVLSYDLYLGADGTTAGKCGGLSQMSVTSATTNKAAYDFTSGFINVQKQTVFADGVQGQRITAAVSQPAPQGVAETNAQPAGTETSTSGNSTSTAPPMTTAYNLPEGTQVVEYDFAKHGRFYVIRYLQLSTYKPAENVLTNFDTMVTQTLHFEQQP